MISISMKQLLEAGVHFGHQSRRWNPKMARYIYTERNGIYIIDLKKTLRMLRDAYKFVADTVAAGGTILFVGTKKQAKEPMEEAAKACNMYYVTSRWLGGMLTNFTTISRSIDRLKSLDRMFEDGTIERYSKKMRAQLGRERARLERNLGGIKNMKNLPTAMFVLDPMKESIAISEARKLHIPIIAVVDTNCDPDPVDLVIPGNDDAIRAVALFAQKMSEAVLEGLMARVEAGEEIELPPAAEALREAALAQAEGSEDDDEDFSDDDLLMGSEENARKDDDEDEDDFDVAPRAASKPKATEAKKEEAPAAEAAEAPKAEEAAPQAAEADSEEKPAPAAAE